jgi:hypothetical protein
MLILDAFGRQAGRQVLSLQAGQNNIPVQVAQLAAGKYEIIWLPKDGNRTSMPFIKAE